MGMVLMIVFALSSDPGYSGGQKQKGSTAMTLEILRAGMRAERERLRSGVFRASGTSSTIESQRSLNHNEPVKLFGAFDINAGVFRFDRYGSEGNKDMKQAFEPFERKVCLTPGGNTFYFSKFNRLEIHPPDVYEPDSLPGVGTYMDVRGLGLFVFGEEFKSANFEDGWEALSRKNQYYDQTPPSVTAADDKETVYVVTWMADIISPAPERRQLWQETQELWIDASRGFTPVKLQKHMILEGKDWKTSPYFLQQTEWEERNGVWVPVQYVAESQVAVLPKDVKMPLDATAPPQPEFRIYKKNWRIKWDSVNEPLDDRIWQYRTWDLPRATRVVDGRSGDLVPIEVLGITTGPLINTEWSLLSWSRNHLALLAGIGLGMIAVALQYFFRIRNRSLG